MENPLRVHRDDVTAHRRGVGAVQQRRRRRRWEAPEQRRRHQGRRHLVAGTGKLQNGNNDVEYSRAYLADAAQSSGKSGVVELHVAAAVLTSKTRAHPGTSGKLLSNERVSVWAAVG